MQANYVTELKRIADALSRTPPWWQHPWLLASLSATLGVIGGFVGQVLLSSFTEFSKRRKMRKMLYADLISLVAVVDATLQYGGTPDLSPKDTQNERRAHFKLIMPKMAEDYIRANPEIYFSLPERIPSASMYALYNHLMSEPENFDGYLRSVIATLSLHFKKNLFNLGAVRKYVGNEEAKSVAATLSRYDLIDNSSLSDE